MTSVTLTKACLVTTALIISAGLANAASVQTSPTSPAPSLSRGYVPSQFLRPMIETALRVDGDTDAAIVNAPVQAIAASDQTYVKLAEVKADMKVSGWDGLLQKYVKAPDASGLARFDYAALKQSSANQAVLSDYIADLESRDPTTMSDNDAIAYWANLYNAVTVKLIVDNYPVTSIRKIKSGAFSIGPWKKKLITVNGAAMSLNDVEHETLRKQYPSPLIHYMVNCASIGCPNLMGGLWTAETLDADRDAAARAFINSPRGAKITDKGLVVSSIYNWFEEDFGGNKQGVLAHLSQYAEGNLKAAIDGGAKIADYDYDWSLNE